MGSDSRESQVGGRKRMGRRDQNHKRNQKKLKKNVFLTGQKRGMGKKGRGIKAGFWYPKKKIKGKEQRSKSNLKRKKESKKKKREKNPEKSNTGRSFGKEGGGTQRLEQAKVRNRKTAGFGNRETKGKGPPWVREEFPRAKTSCIQKSGHVKKWGKKKGKECFSK